MFEFRKPIGFILPIIDIEFIWPILPTIRKLFCNTHQVYQDCLSYGYTKPNKTAFPVVYIEPKTHNEIVQILI